MLYVKIIYAFFTNLHIQILILLLIHYYLFIIFPSDKLKKMYFYLPIGAITFGT